MKLDFQRILVGISLGADLSADLEVTDLDRNAFNNALWLAKKTGATVRLHHSVDWLGAATLDVAPDLADIARERVTEQLGALVAEAAEQGITADISVAFGAPRNGMLEVVNSWSADCVVIGPRAHSSGLVGRLTYGSTARALTRELPCSLWVVLPGSEVGIKKPLFLIDLTPISDELVELGEAMRTTLGAEPELLHCVDFPSDIALRRLPNAREAIKAHHEAVLNRAKQAVDALLGDAAGHWKRSFHDDWVARAAPKIAEQHDRDLLVIAGTSKPGFAGKVLGTTAAKVIGNAPVSTFVVKAKNG